MYTDVESEVMTSSLLAVMSKPTFHTGRPTGQNMRAASAESA